MIALAGGISAGDTAWMLAATALVLLMTPALGLFYAGLVRSKNTLNTFMMSVAALGAVTIAWAFVAYSLAFSGDAGFVGNFDHAFLHDVGLTSTRGLTIPDLLFMAYQATFCISSIGSVGTWWPFPLPLPSLWPFAPPSSNSGFAAGLAVLVPFSRDGSSPGRLSFGKKRRPIQRKM